VAIFFTFLLTAVALIPPPYVWMYESISTLGVTGENPQGWFFFTLAFLSLGVLLIPYFISLFKILKDKVKVVTVLMLIFGFISCAAMFVISIFQEIEEYRDLHHTAAIIALGGLFASAICSWFPLGKKIKEQAKRKGLSNIILVIMIATFLFAAGGMITIVVLQETAGLPYTTPGVPIAGFPFWEWMILLATGVHVFGSWVISTFLLEE
ncbi:MAG: DUF998 domain-containing protein, partial [Candidatus Hodarchaeota archaeon]